MEKGLRVKRASPRLKPCPSGERPLKISECSERFAILRITETQWRERWRKSEFLERIKSFFIWSKAEENRRGKSFYESEENCYFTTLMSKIVVVLKKENSSYL